MKDNFLKWILFAGYVTIGVIAANCIKITIVHEVPERVTMTVNSYAKIESKEVKY